MSEYSNQLQMNPNLKPKDFTSLHELPRIFVNVTKAIDMFVDIWLGREILVVVFFLKNSLLKRQRYRSIVSLSS